MAVFTPPCPYPLHTPTQAFPDCLPLDDPVSTACLGPIVGQAEQVEGPRAPGRLVATWRPLERRQHRLCGMHGQAETGKPPREDFHHPAGVGFQRAADDTSIGKTRDKAPALHPGGHVFDKPFVQDPMQEYLDTMGEITPPCGAPLSGYVRAPDSRTPAWRHLPSSLTMPPSLTLCWRPSRRWPQSRWSQHPLTSASPIQAMCHVRHGSRSSWSAWC